MSGASDVVDAGLQQVGGSRRGTLRLVEQLTSSECGPACLTMVMGLYGRDASIDEVRRGFSGSTQGVDARELLEVGRKFGLRGRAYRVDPEELSKLDAGSILHWNFDHYVVFKRVVGDDVEILDPADGIRRVGPAELDRALTGIALSFEPTDEFRPGSTRSRFPLARYLGVLRTHRRLLLNAIVISVFVQAIGFGPPLALALSVEELIPRGEASALVFAMLAVLILGLCRAVCLFVRGRTLLGLSVRLESSLRSAFVDHLAGLPYSFIGARSTGDLMQRVNSMSALRDLLSSAALSSVLDAGTALAFLVALVAIAPPLALAAIGLAGLNVLLVVLTSRRRERLMTEKLLAEAECQGKQVELLGGIETLKTMGREDALLGEWGKTLVHQLDRDLSLGLFNAALGSLRDLLDLAVPAVLIGIAGYRAAEGTLSLGTLFALSAILPGFISPVTSLVSTVESLVVLQSVARRLNDIFDERTEAELGGDLRPTLTGGVEFEDFSFSYDGRTPVLQGVNLRIDAGQSVGIVGPSGCGKSTLAKCIVGLFTPCEGEVRIDGTPLRALDLSHYRRQVGFVGQSPRLFSGSVRSNIAMGSGAEALAAVESSARVACIHDDIRGFPMGYETPVHEWGSSLSGGQRQRIAIARAVASAPPLLILDEATSALDSETERVVHENLDHVSGTKIIIAHRLSTICNADTIVVMDAGRVVQQGTHDALLGQNGLYRRLWNAQHRGLEHPT